LISGAERDVRGQLARVQSEIVVVTVAFDRLTFLIVSSSVHN